MGDIAPNVQAGIAKAHALLGALGYDTHSDVKKFEAAGGWYAMLPTDKDDGFMFLCLGPKDAAATSKIEAQVMFGSQATQALTDGEAGGALTLWAKNVVGKALKQAASPTSAATQVFTGDLGAAVASMAETAQVAAPAAVTSTSGKEAEMTQSYDIDKLTTGKTIQLGTATKLYQPVRGTSLKSRYFVVAVSGGLKVAARWKSGSMAIRVEGDSINDVGTAKALSAFGFDHVQNGEYGSMHLSVGNSLEQASKVLGSILLGMGVAWTSPWPQLSTIKGKGV